MRHFIRHPSDIPIECRVTHCEPHYRHRMKDISIGGLCFQTPEALDPGCAIQITIPVQEPPFEVTGTIVWRRRTNDHYHVGVKFADANTEFSVRMIEQICHICHYQREVLEKEGRSLSTSEAATEWIARYAGDFPS